MADAIEMLESDNNVSITGLSSLNGPIRGSKKKLKDSISGDWKIFPSDCKKNLKSGYWPPFKGHLITYKSEFMDKFCQTGKFYADDHIQDMITTRMGYSSARYEKSSVYNLGTIKIGRPVSGIDIPIDTGYLKLRRRISSLNSVPPGNFEIIRKK